MGIWTILVLIPGYAEAVGRSQYDQSAVYFIGKKKADLGEVTYILHLTAVASVLLVGSALFLNFEWFYQRLFVNIEPDVRAFAAAMFLLFPLRLIFLNYTYLLIAQEDIKAYNTLVVLQALSTALLSIFLIVVLDAGLSGALAGSLTGAFVAIAYAAFMNHRLPRLSLKLNIKLCLDMGKYASNFYVDNVISYFQHNISSLISAVFLSPALVAFYALGKLMCEVSTRVVPGAINTALFPHVSRLDDDDESALLVARLFRITLLVLTGSSLFLSALIRPVVDLLYGSAYSQAIVPFLIIIPGVIFARAGSVFSTFFSGKGRPDLLPKASIIPLALQVMLSTTLIPNCGVAGAAIGYSASMLCLFFIQAALFLNQSALSIYCLIPGQNDIRTIRIGLLNRLARYREWRDRWRE